jgi:hypothetical protein
MFLNQGVVVGFAKKIVGNQANTSYDTKIPLTWGVLRSQLGIGWISYFQ